MSNTFLKNLVTAQFRFMLFNTPDFDEKQIKSEIESGENTISNRIARDIQPMVNEYKKSNALKKCCLLIKYIVGNKSAKCTIPREALSSYVRTILPDIYAFYESEEGQKAYEEWLKEEEAKERKTKNERL